MYAHGGHKASATAEHERDCAYEQRKQESGNCRHGCHDVCRGCAHPQSSAWPNAVKNCLRTLSTSTMGADSVPIGNHQPYVKIAPIRHIPAHWPCFNLCLSASGHVQSPGEFLPDMQLSQPQVRVSDGLLCLLSGNKGFKTLLRA